MTPIEWTGMILQVVAAIFLPIAASAFAKYWDAKRNEIDNEELLLLGDSLTKAAEELAARDGWNASRKYEYVTKQLKAARPQLDDDQIEALIHSALNAQGMGASGKDNRTKN